MSNFDRLQGAPDGPSREEFDRIKAKLTAETARADKAERELAQRESEIHGAEQFADDHPEKIKRLSQPDPEPAQCEAKKDGCDWLRCELAAGHDGRHRSSIGIESGVVVWGQHHPEEGREPEETCDGSREVGAVDGDGTHYRRPCPGCAYCACVYCGKENLECVPDAATLTLRCQHCGATWSPDSNQNRGGTDG